MKCAYCPLFEYYQSEDGSWANCSLFGDDFQNKLQYEDKHGTTIGCYVERCFIERFAKKRDEAFEDMVEKMEEDIKNRMFFIHGSEL